MARTKKDTTTTATTPLAPVIPFDGNAKPASTPKFGVSEWVYYAYELLQVKAVNKDWEVTEVGDGNAKVSAKEGTTLSADILPLNEGNKLASDVFLKIAQEFSSYSTFARLNVQLVHSWLVKQWLGYAAATGDKKKQEAILAGVSALGKTIVESVQKLHTIKFENEQLFA